ncbi:hypothetical protein CSOJ01_04556 [Colletotrichum sojae]|uniref:Uncharacterized protein n=1 Tax=Colletotrichum sojae TaxID=2175907 RepID=A0A8H6JHX7_9PEZI|nr:hypothetical protein CSOJ01_04556 [Colletotrichum sojae]
MQFNFAILALFAAVASPVTATCDATNDCCISTRGACRRQSKDWTEKYIACPMIKLCPDEGVSWKQCNADCCSLSTKAGRGCPGK